MWASGVPGKLGSRTSKSSEDLTSNLEREVLSLAGLSSTDTVTAEMQRNLGNGTLHTDVAMQIGRRVVTKANLESRGMADLDNTYQDRLAVSIGNMVTATLVKMQVAEMTRVNTDYIHRLRL